MADPNLTIGIGEDGSGGQARYIPPERMDAALAHLKKKGVRFRAIEPAAEEAAAPSFLSFGKDAAEPMHAAVQEDETLLEPGTRRLKSPEQWRKVGESEEVVAGEGDAEVTQAVPQFATSPQQKAHRNLRRFAQRQVNKRPPAIGFPGRGTEGLNPLVTYDHFDASIPYIMSKTTDHDDITDLIENGDESETAAAYRDQVWSKVHDTYQKHGLAAVRVDKANEGENQQPGYDVYGAAMQYGMAPLVYGADTIATFGLGRQAMSAAVEGFVTSDAEKELIANGTVMRPSERLKDLSERSLGSMPATIAGFALGSRGAVGRGVGKLGTAMNTALKARGLGKKTASALAGAGVAMGELAGEEAVETAGETLRGAPRTVASGTEAAMTGMFGAGARMAGDAAGRIKDELRHISTPHGRDLAQQEALTGERGTTMLGGMHAAGARKPPWVAKTEEGLDELRRSSTEARDEAMHAAGDDAAAIAKASDAFPIHGGSVTEEMGKIAKRALVRLHAKESEAIKLWGDENRAFYQDNAGLEVDMIKIKDALTELKEAGSTFTARGDEMVDLPFMDTKDIDVLIERFDEVPTMNAETFDETLGALQEIIYDRGRSGSKTYKKLEQAMMETREGFGPYWAATKLRHKNEQVDLLNSFDAMGQRGVEKNADMLTNIERAVSKMGALGTSTITDEAWYRIVRDEPGLMEQLKQAAATHPYEKRTAGTGIPFTVGAMVLQAQTRLDPVSGLIERTMNRAGPAMSVEAGTASERALSTAGGMEAQIDKVRALVGQQDKLAEREEDSP